MNFMKTEFLKKNCCLGVAIVILFVLYLQSQPFVRTAFADYLIKTGKIHKGLESCYRALDRSLASRNSILSKAYLAKTESQRMINATENRLVSISNSLAQKADTLLNKNKQLDTISLLKA